ncbi:MAG TPA: hypothetical protein VGI81_13260 [Tepidisphaeraceae bacterium]|jgi:hypothetical protein
MDWPVAVYVGGLTFGMSVLAWRLWCNWDRRRELKHAGRTVAFKDLTRGEIEIAEIIETESIYGREIWVRTGEPVPEIKDGVYAVEQGLLVLPTPSRAAIRKFCVVNKCELSSWTVWF